MLGLARGVSTRFLLASASEVYEIHPQYESHRVSVNTIEPQNCQGKRIAKILCFDYKLIHETEIW